MFWPAPASFRAQATIIAAASLAVVGLAGFIVYRAIRTTEGALVADSRQLCISACNELREQYEERIKEGDLLQMPPEAQDLSLTGISQTVLRTFEGVDGGIYLPKQDYVMGYAAPPRPAGPRPRPRGPRWEFIRSLAERAMSSSEIVTGERPYDTTYLVAAAVRSKSGEAVIWTMRRTLVARDPLMEEGRWWLAALVFSSVLGVFGIVSIWHMLRSGVEGVQRGLHRLEDDFTHRIPTMRGDFGLIAMAINRMAERRMALEEELRRQDRLAALGKVVSGVAHEVRNPLNSMKLKLQLLERRLTKGIPASDEIQEALREIDRLDMIVSRLLAFGRPAILNRQVQALQPLVEQAIRMVQEPAHKKDVRFETREMEDSLEVDVDGPQIVQVLINLFLNAIDASSPSGLVRVGAERSNGCVRVAVSDQGLGIAEEVKPHIFDAYYTTKPNGSGLGLAVSREIVANHGGRLELETSPAGTSFFLMLPIDRSRPL